VLKILINDLKLIVEVISFSSGEFGSDRKGIDLNKKILHDCDAAQEKFKSFEFAYRVLRPAGLGYLRGRSAAYKQAVLALQEVILPAVRRRCPECPHGTCCRLYSPELSIYIARAVGGFDLVDYLLARCEEKFPAPNFENNRRNLCAFWDKGCRLGPSTRSLLCLQYFCDSLRRDLNMDLVELRLAAVRTVGNGFSLKELFK
jgi:hypothetical protein